MHWQIGDRAIIDCPSSIENGVRTTILAVDVAGHSPGCGDYIGYEVNIHCSNGTTGYCIFEHHELIPIPDEYDGLSVTTWDAVPPAFRLSRFPEKVTV